MCLFGGGQCFVGKWAGLADHVRLRPRLRGLHRQQLLGAARPSAMLFFSPPDGVQLLWRCPPSWGTGPAAPPPPPTCQATLSRHEIGPELWRSSRPSMHVVAQTSSLIAFGQLSLWRRRGAPQASPGRLPQILALPGASLPQASSHLFTGRRSWRSRGPAREGPFGARRCRAGVGRKAERRSSEGASEGRGCF